MGKILKTLFLCIEKLKKFKLNKILLKHLNGFFKKSFKK